LARRIAAAVLYHEAEMSGTPAAVSQPRLGTVRAWGVVLVATATMAISYLDRQVLAVLAPSVTEDLGIGEEAYGWLASAFSIAYLVSAPLAGRLIERVGVRRGLLGAVLVWTAVSAGHALVPGYGVLFAMRLALGTAESPSFPGSAAAIARVLPPHARPAGMGVLFTGSSFGAMVAPPLAVGLAGWLGGWRAAFVGVAIVGALWIPLWLTVTSARDVKHALSVELEGSARASMFGTLAHPAVLRACALVVAVSPVFAFLFLWGAKILHRQYGVLQEDVDTYLWLPPLLFDLGAVGFGTVAARWARQKGAWRTPTAIVLVAFGLVLAMAFAPLCDGPWGLTILVGVALAGGGGLFAILMADMIARVGPAVAATAGGVTAAAQSLAYIVANPLIGRGVEHFGNYDLVFVGLVLWIVPGALLWLLTGRGPVSAAA
jgi:ACS family hexuronate transporter-like MFS transporter